MLSIIASTRTDPSLSLIYLLEITYFSGQGEKCYDLNALQHFDSSKCGSKITDKEERAVWTVCTHLASIPRRMEPGMEAARPQEDGKEANSVVKKFIVNVRNVF